MNINDLEKSIQKSVKNFEDAKKELHEKMKSEISNVYKVYFETHPFVESVIWGQYTPYFNDGSPCTFTVHDRRIELEEGYNFPEKYSGDLDHLSDTDYYLESTFDFHTDMKDFLNESEENKKSFEKIQLALDDLRIFDLIPDFIWEELGEGEVIVSRDGHVEIEEIAHD